MKKPPLYIFVLLTLFACEPKEGEEYLAKAYDNYLYIDDLPFFNLTGQDSVNAVQSYVADWLKKQVVVNQAELNLPDSLKNVSRQLEEYENSLLIYTYEQSLLKQRLDTNISQKEIFEYYELNKQNFELKDYLVKVIFCKAQEEALEDVELSHWKTNETDSIVKEFNRFAVDLIDGKEWMPLNNLLVKLPIKVNNQEEYALKTKFKRFSFEEFTYFVHITDLKMKDEISPLSVVEEKIKAILLNKRKTELLKKMKSDLYKVAFNSKKIESKL